MAVPRTWFYSNIFKFKKNCKYKGLVNIQCHGFPDKKYQVNGGKFNIFHYENVRENNNLESECAK